MTQKIFYANGKEDKDLLWSILPDSTQKIVRGDGQILLFNSEGECFATIESFVLKINWQDKREIARPVNYEDMIGCIGWFWDCDDFQKRLGIFKCMDKEYFCDEHESRWGHFTPAKKSELKFWENEE